MPSQTNEPLMTANSVDAVEHEAYSRWTAEFIGTFFLVFTIGCAVHSGCVAAAIAIGGMLMVMIYSLGSVSGGHFNPAVTFAVRLSGRDKISDLDTVAYMLFQLAGAIVGAFMYRLIMGQAFMLEPVALYTTADAVGAEILFTAALCYVVLNVATTAGEKGNVCDGRAESFAAMAIGMTVTAAAIAVGPISGCSLNPAVSAGSMLAAATVHGAAAFRYSWVYNLSPFAGAFVAFIFFWLVRRPYEYPLGAAPLPKPRPQPVVREVVRTEPARAPAPAPEPPKAKKREVVVRRGSRVLQKAESVDLSTMGKDMENHNLFAGLYWQVTVSKGEIQGTDIDLSAVKFDRHGHSLGAVYFADKRDSMNSIEHSGDQVAGSDGNALDLESISFRLSHLNKNVHVLFFCATIFSSYTVSFKDVKQCAVRLVDVDEGSRELCRFDKQDISQGNALVIAMLYRKGDDWCFKAIDECFQIQAHGTYRALEPMLQKFWRQTCQVGADP